MKKRHSSSTGPTRMDSPDVVLSESTSHEWLRRKKVQWREMRASANFHSVNKHIYWVEYPRNVVAVKKEVRGPKFNRIEWPSVDLDQQVRCLKLAEQIPNFVAKYAGRPDTQRESN